MDASGRMNKLKENKGIAIVYVALMLVVLLGFVGLAIDLGYMYVAKGQLQNAADAAALAGASKLDGSADTMQIGVRNEAKKFGEANRVANENVTIDLNTSNNEQGDIAIGFWDAKATPPFTTQIAPGGIANAVQVIARRTDETSSDTNGVSIFNKPVGLFFSKVLNIPSMGAKAKAIATRPIRATIPIALCVNACSVPPNSTFYFMESDLGTNPQFGAAWTEFSTQTKNISLGPNGNVSDYITKDLPFPDVCGRTIFTNNGTGEVIKELQDAYNTKNVGGVWEVVVPIVQASVNPCTPPGNQPTEPYLVTQYALIKIKQVYTASQGTKMDVSEVNCVPCNTLNRLGNKAILSQ